jgi:hypothetical protein
MGISENELPEDVEAIGDKKKMEIPKEGNESTELVTEALPNEHNPHGLPVMDKKSRGKGGQDYINRLEEIFDNEGNLGLHNSPSETDESEK